MAVACILTTQADAAALLRPHPEPQGALYTPIRGRMEFSGRLLVRPAAPEQIDDPADEFARRLIEPNVIDYLADMDTYVVVVPDGSSENAYGAELLATGLYEWVRPDWILYPQGSPNDPGYPLQWHLPKISAPGAWRFTKGSPKIVVAVVDTGVDPAHPDLAPILVPGICSYWQNQGQVITHDDNGHGTSVAGAAVAVGDNGIGGCGVAWDLRVMPIRATRPGSATGGASFSDIQWGAKWAADHGARIINCSWSGVAEPNVEALGQVLRAKGALLVWPMDSWPGSPTSFDHPSVIVVNGTTAADQIYGTSNWGPGVDLAAPAQALWLPARGGGYAWKSGNSFAAPLVAGSIGLVWSIGPSMTPTQVEWAVKWSAADIGPSGQDDAFGYGRVDPYIAIVNVLIRNIAHPHQPQFVTEEDKARAINQWQVDR